MDPPARTTARLAAAGCVSAGDEAAALLGAAGGDARRLESLLVRREAGEPLAWLVGTVDFGGVRLRIEHGVYVPRPHTVELAQRAARHLPEGGTAVDLCTGCGAIAAVLARAVPSARVLATDIDRAAVACARANGVDADESDLEAALPAWLTGHTDVVTSVPPYVPDAALALLPRDVQEWEPRRALVGGEDGLAVTRRVVVGAATRLLGPGGHLLVEIGGDQYDTMRGVLKATGFEGIEVLRDADGDDRGVEAVRSA